MVKVIVGLMGSSVAKGSASLATPSQVSSFLDVCKKYGVSELDTARVYNDGKSEELLGQVEEKKEFQIATKAPAFSPGSLTYKNIMENCNKSLHALQMDKVDIYYLHGPDTQTPLEERCKAIGELYKEGKFKRFGLSNLKDEVVEEIYEICKKNGTVLPTVYQGGYNAIHRKSEDTLQPLLKKLNIQYYAWGPLAGGALAKNINDVLNPKEGSRYQAMPVFGSLFLKDKMVEALKKITAQCEEFNLTLLEASLRWLKHHSPLGPDDGFIIGASTNEQVEASLKATQGGPLDEKLVKAFDDMWVDIKDVAPQYAN
jgi:aflatoxin B1 aldehyde reductase